MKRLWPLLGISAALAGAGCQTDRIAGPVRPHGPGALEARLTTPNLDDDALLLELRGGPIDSITSAAYDIATFESAPGEYRALLRGTLTGGAVLQLWVPELGDHSAYAVAVVEAVGRGSYVNRDVAGYEVTVDLPEAPR